MFDNSVLRIYKSVETVIILYGSHQRCDGNTDCPACKVSLLFNTALIADNDYR